MKITISLPIILTLAILGPGVARGAAEPSAAAPVAGALDADTHLVGWWKFDETTGKKAADSAKTGHDGTLEGEASFETQSAPGRIGRALRLDGKAGVRVAGYKGVTGTHPRTIAAWIRTALPKGEIVSWGLNDFGKMWTLSFIRSHLGVTPKGGYYYMKAKINDETWHHVAAVLGEGSPPNLHDHMKLYLDGAPAEVDDIGLLDLWPIETGDQEDLGIGQHYEGLIDDLRLYDRPLGDEEIKALFEAAGDQPAAKPDAKGAKP